ncbi:VOC family protein [Streptomyces sp. NPDC005805]|uniref:VOC family protein n=1 Tax=Streptomyces sp. NPDC005805 TaxID=3157068 RepID=UPI0033E6457E
MATRLNPYISFSGDAKQALEFYRSVLGGDLRLSTFGEMNPDLTGDEANQIMHGMLETPAGFTLMCADTPPGMPHSPGTNFAVSLSGDNADELKGYWEKLSADGTVTVPLEKQMWGDVFGMCTDRFGIAWMVDIHEPQG